MPQRPPGVYKRGSTWAVVIDQGRHPETGKRKKVWHSGYRTMREATEARTHLLREQQAGTAVDTSRMTVGQYLMEQWLPARMPEAGEVERGHRGKLGIGAWASYRADLSKYAIPYIGGVQLQKLGSSDLDRLYDELERNGGRRQQGLSAKTVVNVHGILHKALNDAVRAGLVQRNIADLVAPPRSSRPATKWWSPQELRAFLRHVEDDRMYALWLLFATTGMRRGEVLGLVWDDIDFEGGTVTVDWTLGVVDGKPTWKRRAKSRAGQRTMALDPTTIEALRAHRARQAEERLFMGTGWLDAHVDWRGESRAGRVFCWPDGTVIHPERVSKWFQQHLAAAQLPRVRLHDVRHTYASAALAHAQGWHEVKIISQRLGHASVGITLDTYSHVLPAADEQAAASLARVILGE